MNKARDAKLQADCDRVDAIERAHSKIMFALKDMGWEWKLGAAGPVSEYNQTYACWANGPHREGEPIARRFRELDNCIDAALAMFTELWGSGERFIVWRIAPEFSKWKGRSVFGESDTWKLYMRWHTMNKIPADYLERHAEVTK